MQLFDGIYIYVYKSMYVYCIDACLLVLDKNHVSIPFSLSHPVTADRAVVGIDDRARL